MKVNRYITHYYKLSGRALELWDKFKGLFKPMDDLIEFYLVQLPPSFRLTEENRRRLIDFAKSTGLKWRLAVEFRHESWFKEEIVGLCRDYEITVVSIDSPMGMWVRRSGDSLYMRLHGRSSWYLYEYKRGELEEIAKEIVNLKPRRAFIFLNNNHYMLDNARMLKGILEDMVKESPEG